MAFKVSFGGFAGRDGERIETKTGRDMAKVSVAVSIERPKEGAEAEPWWIEVVGFNRAAADVESIRKGDRVHVMGTLERHGFVRQDGGAGISWQCVADGVMSVRVPLAGPKSQADDAPTSDYEGYRETC